MCCAHLCVVNTHITLQEKSDDFIASMAEPLRDDERAKLEGKMDEVIAAVFLLFLFLLLFNYMKFDFLPSN
jgi:hypothetical protein